MQANHLPFPDSGLKGTNRKLLYIFLFNMTDGILTYIGISNNYAVEMNLLMTSIVSDFARLLLIKLLLPSAVILFAALIMNKFKHLRMPVANFFINICFYAYLLVFLAHLLWIGLTIHRFLLP